jgi:hypothetical protein
MRVAAAPGTAQNRIVNARRHTIEAAPRAEAPHLGTKACTCCAKDFQALHSRQKFCSNRCRFLYWAAGEAVREYLAGHAPGLGGMLEKLRK